MTEGKTPLTGIAEAALGRALDAVKYAEAKNAVLITVASATSAVSLAALDIPSIADRIGATYLQMAGGLFMLGGAIALLSFMPVLSMAPVGKLERGRGLIFVNDVSQLRLSAFLDRFRERYGSAEDSEDLYLHDLVIQLWVNSSIACRKFRVFNFSALVMLFGLLFIAIGIGF